MNHRGLAVALTLTFGLGAAADQVARADEAGEQGKAAKPTFEALSKSATRVDRGGIAGLLWAVSASCDGAGDALDVRQCRAIKAARADRLADQTFIVPGDAGAFVVGAFDVKKKSIPLTLSGCVACVEPIEVAGKQLYVVANKAAPTFAGAVAKAAVIHETTRTFSDEEQALDWRAKVVPRLQTEFVVRLVERGAVWQRDGKDGVAVEILGFRVFDPCDGGIVCASPASGKAAVDRAACGEAVVEGEAGDGDGDGEAPPPKPAKEAALPDELSAAQVKEGMKPVREAAAACFATYGVPGSAKLKVTVSGGEVIALEWKEGDLADTPTGACIEKAARAVVFPKTKKNRQSFTYPIVLR